MDDPVMTIQCFQKCIETIVNISKRISDDWKMNCINETTENNKFLTKKQTLILHTYQESDSKLIATFEYNVVYNISYSVPVLCFDIWRPDGTRILLEEYWKYNENLKDYSMFDTLTQMDHPILNRPIFTLHPCKTQEILQTFKDTSKNPVISWLSVVSRFVHLEILEDYLQCC